MHRADPADLAPAEGLGPWAEDRDAGRVAIASGLDLRAYPTLIVERPTINAADMGDDEDRRLSAEALTALREKLLAGLQGIGTFQRVADVQSEPVPPGAGKVLRLRINVSRFSPGERALRALVGFGAGRTKLQVESRFVDAQTGRAMLATADRWIASKGLAGGSARDFLLESVDEVSKGLVALVRRLSNRPR